MLEVRKACACLLRSGAQGTEVLVFDHPVAGTQLPKGTVESGESSTAAVVRELAEETGVEATVIRSLGLWSRVTGAGPDEAGDPERHQWEIFELHALTAQPDSWEHSAIGSEAELGLLFQCRWIRVAHAGDVLHPLFRSVAELLQRAVADRE